MKKFHLLFIVLLTGFLFTGCKEEPLPTRLSIAIAVQPTGGSSLTSVSIIFAGTVTGTIKPVTATVEWWWENGYHSDQELVLSNTYSFDTGYTISQTSYCYAPSGYYLVNYYWAKIRWTDDDGPHVLESEKAYFGD